MVPDIDIRSKELLQKVTDGLDFTIPNVDFNDKAFQIPDELIDALQKVPDQLTTGSLTERVIHGNGVFDAIMEAMEAHLKREYEEGRITGAEYTKAYIATLQSSVQFAVQFLLGKDQAYYQALGAQTQALIGNLEAYNAKVKLAIAQAQAHMTKAQYAAQVLQLAGIEANTDNAKQQELNLKQQEKLLKEQTEQAHAQVSDTQLDGSTPVTGYTGNQNSLLKQQVVAFKKDAIVKAAKIYTDSFATQLSMSTATVAGTGLDAAGIKKATDALQASLASSS